MKYFITLIDDFTNFVMIYALKEKSDVFDKIKEYTSYVKTKFDRGIERIRCDNGGGD